MLRLAILALAQETLPEGPTGIASKFPYDAGIASHPGVVFSDDFEAGRVKAQNNWGGVAVTRQRENVHAGAAALELKLVPDPQREVGLGFNHHLHEGFDTLFLRYYAKFAPDAELYHGGAHNGACIDARAPGVPDAEPGVPADGRRKYTVLLDTWRAEDRTPSPGNLVVYVYHPEQRHGFGEHFFPSGKMLPFGRAPGSYFQPGFAPRPEFIPERGRWYCYELMVKANSVGRRDGRIAFWVDGRLAADFPNLRLRDVGTLKSNIISIGMSTKNQKTRPSTMWVDDVVAAAAYIGPMRAAAKSEEASKDPGLRTVTSNPNSPFSTKYTGPAK